jgi:hypothetical protein
MTIYRYELRFFVKCLYEINTGQGLAPDQDLDSDDMKCRIQTKIVWICHIDLLKKSSENFLSKSLNSGINYVVFCTGTDTVPVRTK